MVIGLDLFHFDALNFSTRDLEEAKHIYKLVAQDEVILHLDHHHMGVFGRGLGAGGVGAAVGDAGGAQQAEGDRVAAGLGEEVAAEAEHVRPAAQPPPVGGAAEAPAGVDEPFGVVAVGVGVDVDGLRGRAGVEAWPVTSVDLVAYLAR